MTFYEYAICCLFLFHFCRLKVGSNWFWFIAVAASSKLLRMPVMSSTPRGSDGSEFASLDGDQELDLRSKKLSSTLHKLYLWEKKLYEEVKVGQAVKLLSVIQSFLLFIHLFPCL